MRQTEHETLETDALIVGGGALEASQEFQSWFIEEIRAGMPTQREEQADKARMADRIERLRLQRQQAAARTTLAAGSDDQFLLIAAE